MASKTEQIRKRIIQPFAVVMLAVLVLGALGGYRLQQYHLNREVDTKLNGVNALFFQLLNQESKFMEAQLQFLAHDDKLINAWQRRDMDGLYRAASPLFQKIQQDFGVTHFYFIDPKQVCVLRVHKPDRRGDDIKRYTMRQAAEQRSMSSGIELGPLGTFTLRVVYPWFHKGELIGYLELGEEIEHLTSQMKKISELDLIFTIDKSELDRKKWEIGVKFLNKNDTWEDFDDFVIIDKTLENISPKMSNYLVQAHGAQGSSNRNMTVDDRTFRLAALPLVDAGMTTVGTLIALNDVTDKIAVLNNLLLSILAAVLLVGGAVFVFFYKYSGRIEKQLANYQNNLEHLVAERTEELERAMEEVQALSGLLPICSFCKRIRDDEGYWNQLEGYISKHSDAKFSHSICGECMKKHYPEVTTDPE